MARNCNFIFQTNGQFHLFPHRISFVRCFLTQLTNLYFSLLLYSLFITCFSKFSSYFFSVFIEVAHNKMRPRPRFLWHITFIHAKMHTSTWQTLIFCNDAAPYQNAFWNSNCRACAVSSLLGWSKVFHQFLFLFPN